MLPARRASYQVAIGAFLCATSDGCGLFSAATPADDRGARCNRIGSRETRSRRHRRRRADGSSTTERRRPLPDFVFGRGRDALGSAARRLLVVVAARRERGQRDAHFASVVAGDVLVVIIVVKIIIEIVVGGAAASGRVTAGGTATQTAAQQDRAQRAEQIGGDHLDFLIQNLRDGWEQLPQDTDCPLVSLVDFLVIRVDQRDDVQLI